MVAVVLLCPTILIGAKELEAGFSRGIDQVARFDNARAGRFPDPLSFSAARQVLLDCMESADGLYGMLQGKDDLAEMAGHCRAFAERTMESNPHYGFAALVSARMSAVAEDWQNFNAMLRLSQAGASTEQWISLERLKLYSKFEQHLEPATVAARTDDIGLLLISPVGVRSIAQLYVNDARLRELITQEAEKSPEKVKRRFLQKIREVLGR